MIHYDLTKPENTYGHLHESAVLFTCKEPGCYVRFTINPGLGEDVESIVAQHQQKNCYDRRIVSMATLIGKMWEEVDSLLNELMHVSETGDLGDKTAEEFEQLKGQLQGATKMIYIMTSSHYEDYTDVKKEAVARRNARLEGRYHLTAGCSEKPSVERVPSTWERKQSTYSERPETSRVPPKPKPAPRAKKSKEKFTEEELAKIVKAYEAGFPLPMLAAANSCKETDIADALTAIGIDVPDA